MSESKPHAVITGGEGSVGRTLARELRDHDWNVEAPGKAVLDVRNPDHIRNYFGERRVDLLVCAAGITRDALLIKTDEDSWDSVWQVNFRGALQCAEAVLPTMIAAGSGHIVFISSYSARQPPIGQAAYATAKAALLGLVSDLAPRHGPSNIRVNAVLPGFLETRMTENIQDHRRAAILENHALGRFNTCPRVAGFIRFLHEELPHTSGQLFQLDSRVENH
jgi:3-oxoacyl-[acyl-carrier protein] reductase